MNKTYFVTLEPVNGGDGDISGPYHSLDEARKYGRRLKRICETGEALYNNTPCKVSIVDQDCKLVEMV